MNESLKKNDEKVDQATAAAPESVDQIDRLLQEWFSRHSTAWCGTASELLAALKTEVGAGDESLPQSSAALYSRLESHRQEIQSLGIAITLSTEFPRMISVRQCGEEPAKGNPPRETPAAPTSGNTDDSGSVGDNTAETLIAILRTSASAEHTRLGTISRLAEAPGHLRTAIKRVWTSRKPAI